MAIMTYFTAFWGGFDIECMHHIYSLPSILSGYKRLDNRKITVLDYKYYLNVYNRSAPNYAVLILFK